MAAARGWGVGSGRLMGAGLPSAGTVMFWNLLEVMVAQHGKCTKCHWTVHFKMTYFYVCEFCLNFKKMTVTF